MRRSLGFLLSTAFAFLLAFLQPSLVLAFYELRSILAGVGNLGISKALILTVHTQEYFLAVWQICVFGLGALCLAVLIGRGGEVRLALRRTGEFGGAAR